MASTRRTSRSVITLSLGIPPAAQRANQPDSRLELRAAHLRHLPAQPQFLALRIQQLQLAHQAVAIPRPGQGGRPLRRLQRPRLRLRLLGKPTQR